MNKRKVFRSLFSWSAYNLLLPLIPLVLGLSVAYLRAIEVPYVDLFGGTELYFFSMTILASTRSDLDNSKIDIRESIIYSIFSILLLLFALFTAALFGMVYINQNVVDIGFQKETTANYAIVTSILSTFICFPLQIFISVVNNKNSSNKKTTKK